MSMLGTGVAAGVAGVALQAQSVARQRDRQNVHTARDIRRMQELLQTHLDALDEGDTQSPAQLHVDDQLPDHHSPPQYDGMLHQHRQGQGGTAETQGVTPPSLSAAHDDADTPLYRHVDVTA